MIKTPDTRREQAELTRQNIFNATIDLINEVGFNKVTIRNICKNSNVSIGTFYIYFSSKDDILLEMYRQSDEYIPQYNLETTSPRKAILDIVSHTIKNTIIKFDKSILKEIYRIHLTSNNDYFLSEDRTLFKSLCSIISYYKTNNLLLMDIDEHVLTWKIHVFVRGIVFSWLISDSDESILDIAVSDLDMYLNLFIKEI